MKFSEIVDKLGDLATQNSLPDLDPDIQGVSPIDAATPDSLSFIEGARFASKITQTTATALIIPPQLQAEVSQRGIAWIAASEPRLVFAKAIALFYQPYRPLGQIHPTAAIDPAAEIGENVYIGAHAVVQAGVKIGNEVCIHPNVVIYPDARIGDRTTLHANCTIHERSQIGANCVIHSGAVIGSEGFGFVPTPQGWYKMEQAGYTVLEDGVEVGCNTAIDRPAVGETRIGRNTKIDNLVQIGHGCQIGSNCAIAGQAGMAGGVQLGNNVILAGQSGISNQAKIGDGAIASAKAGIHHDIEPGEIVSGIPAMPHKQFLKVAAIYGRLPELYQSLKQLQRRLGEKSAE
ncbi:UDP-3-O-(3-hydroxymyristoyl)glucosamine N-acyltransferase [Desertifilum sp. FACHB-1129]|uniref:UDP-3-O-acylglucosamine N-acyltransferase n=1 Tax=Desertifilum tharense IPPAS B-1220 TaxID=1781255 RepID=A0A1E5QLE7_9CYAN|nr:MULTISPECIES: UDP-3-O-(3-hydroxymyristoyl)glucosamine N-acyltransferase [Desertifilum]MDA0209946.1 UDP-3-O-(3-hydroxymyristoyl)glucosamine N-acyltransferase [Cyanobacteria bacterium FC1]MBD2313786.1 UDP-3-O-(3-hydroxymyristoyl)glucosamine N-acyltransferase [Desertifilum sp. FACHB-1129]MBD2324503.1 UDP-3-O-(3-hydroxymyristoyl)glucosamine N-acyltransferase [Desertifilum sp. FACHB-866]MBD2334517.1 UDP-3-O-(3-hydroxymyristoyl)glucosamine N-acyltransferase [Desertifilum sp. FACHB-868]OEJ75448.1 